ncbi:adenylyltransferase/cytidyltransferase family protein [Candidatus Nomurabacteria bacterium]|nr:adenylyltransferase/cytidyltransferase family protein [Candidatus Nomurabacteria bacterium]
MSVKKIKTRIMAFGTFDGLHRGHLNFFQQARNLAKLPFLIVSIARNKNILKIKGQYPVLSLKKRLLLLKKSSLVDKVVISGLKNHIPHIVKERPDVIALGYDQKNYVKNLKKDLKAHGLNVKIVRLRPYKEKIYKNHLLKKNPRHHSSLL